MDARFIMTSFWQPPDYGNCSTVALLKAAFIQFGVSGVYKKRRRTGDSTLVTLRNGKAVQVFDRDMTSVQAEQVFAFSRYKDERKKSDLQRLKKEVWFALSVMMRYLKTYGLDGEAYSKKEAIEDLVYNGIFSDEVYKLLGLRMVKKTRLRMTDLERFPSKRPLIIYDIDHAVVAYNGLYDNFGTSYPMSDIRDLYGEIRGCFRYELAG